MTGLSTHQNMVEVKRRSLAYTKSPQAFYPCKSISIHLCLVATNHAVRMSIISVHSAIANSFSTKLGQTTSGEIFIEDNTISNVNLELGQALYTRWYGLGINLNFIFVLTILINFMPQKL